MGDIEAVCTAALHGRICDAAYLYLCVLPVGHEGIHKAQGPSGTFILATWDEFVPGAHDLARSA